MSKDDNPNLIIPNAFLYDGIEIINKSHAVASMTHMCVHCHKLFNILDSVGRWECRQHTGKLELDPRIKTDCAGPVAASVKACCATIIVKLLIECIVRVFQIVQCPTPTPPKVVSVVTTVSSRYGANPKAMIRTTQQSSSSTTLLGLSHSSRMSPNDPGLMRRMAHSNDGILIL